MSASAPSLKASWKSKVKTGQFDSVSEVVREALWLLEERDQLFVLHQDEIRHKIKAGMDSLRAGKSEDGEAVFDRIDAELEANERSSKQSGPA